MMTEITDLHEIEKIIGNMLVKQSGLSKSRVMNAITPRGVDLAKFVTEKVKLSYDLKDVVIIFEISAANSDGIVFTEYENNNIRENAVFEIRTTIYGNEATGVAKILKARFESEKVRTDLLNVGLYLIDTSSIQSMNEYLNETIWPRADLSFRIACELHIVEVDSINEISKLISIN